MRVLFVCTGNGSRSQIAEALLRHEAGDRVDVVSGGSHPKPIHPNTITVLLERGIDASTLRSKTYEEFATRPFDHVITLCDKVREICPEFPGHGSHRHWSVEDPSARSGTARTTLPAFRALAADLESRIRFLNLELANQSQKETHRHGR
ncbi:MAG TPA: arsenate reductase ArsC [Ilumatobacteraceae bacterium]